MQGQGPPHPTTTPGGQPPAVWLRGRSVPIATSFSSHHDGGDRSRASLRPQVKCPRTAEVSPLPPASPSGSLSDEYLHSGQTSAMRCLTVARGTDLCPGVVEVQSHLYPTAGALEPYELYPQSPL